MEQHKTFSPQDLESKFRSKEDQYSRLTKDCLNFKSKKLKYRPILSSI